MPFISGISGMKWRRFTPFSVLGGLTWSTLFTLLGYFFGGIPFVQNNFELVIVAILLISLTPTFVGLIKARTGKQRGRGRDAEPARHAAADAGIGAGAEMLSSDLSGANVLSAETIAAATVKDAADLTEATPQD